MRKEISISVTKELIHQYQLDELFPEALLPKLEIHYYAEKEYVYIANESPQYFSICLKGRMKVIPSSEEGKIVLIDYLRPLSIIGDIELFCGCNYLHCVLAVTPVTILAIPRKLFLNEMMENTVFLRFMCITLSEKLNSSSKNHSLSLLYPVKTRLYYYVLQLSDEADSDTVAIKMVEAAQYLGISERHLRRILDECQEEGSLLQTSHQLKILNRALLEKNIPFLE